MRIAIAVFVLLAAAAASEAATSNIYCYFGSWAAYRQSHGHFDVEDIDVNSCTHVTYSFIGLNDDGTTRILDNTHAVQRNGLTRFVDLRKKQPKLKVLVSMGGWSEGSERYSKVIGDRVKRARLVNSVYDFVVKYRFDGFDFDWEYPAKRGGAASDYVTYIDFLRELRTKFGKNRLITAAVGADPDLIRTSYNVRAMNGLLDYINLMTYDFNGYYNNRTGHNSPLFAGNDANRNYNIDAAVTNWIQNGASPQKLIMGLGFYGQTFTLANPQNNGVGALATGAGNQGAVSQQSGLMMYREICEDLKSGGWTERYDETRESPYAFKGNQWWGYDNERSIRVKAKYAVTKNLAGVMMWAIDYEDHRNRCGRGNNPLLAAIVSVIRS